MNEDTTGKPFLAAFDAAVDATYYDRQKEKCLLDRA